MRTGLYNPGDFKDNCGFGLLAHLEGEQSHELLVTAIKSLTCMTHANDCTKFVQARAKGRLFYTSHAVVTNVVNQM